LTVKGGNGGNGGGGGPIVNVNNGYGGSGGAALLNGQGYDFTVNGDVAIAGGNTGNPGAKSYGGSGGAAEMRVKTLQVGGTLAVTSGQGISGGAVGGAAAFTADTLIAPTISLTKQGGTFSFNVTDLDVTTGSTTLNLTKTLAADVTINAVLLSGNNTFTVTSANSGAGTFNTLDVNGSGGTLAGTYNPTFSAVNLAGGSSLTATNPLNFATMNVRGAGASYTGNLNAAGKSLNFYLSPSMKAGDTLLAVQGNADIAGANVGLDTSSGRPNIAVGENLILLDATGGLNGAPVTLTVQASNGDVYALTAASDQIQAVLQSLAPTGPAYERLKAYAEARAASLALVNQGADLLLNQGFGSALAATAKTGGRISR
jgi:hypothetical protein